MKKLSFVFVVFLVCLMATGASATVYWVGGASGNWNVASNWNTAANGSGSSGVPGTGDEADIGSASTAGDVTVTLDTSTVIDQLFLGKGVTGNHTYTLTYGGNYTLEVKNAGSKGDPVILGYTNGSIGIINQSQGTFQLDATATSDVQINHVSPGTYGSAYNLSGGLLIVPTIRKYNQTSEGPGLVDTGGTIVVTNAAYRLAQHANADASTQVWVSGSTLAPGGVGTIGVFNVGLSGYAQSIQLSDSSVIQIDLASASSYDVMHSSNKVDLTYAGTKTAEGELYMNALDDFVPTLNQLFTVWNIDLKSGQGTGTGLFASIGDNLPGYFIQSNSPDGKTLGWSTTGYNPTFTVEYIPEPATVCLLGLGALSLLKKRRA